MVISTKWLVIGNPWPGDTNKLAPRAQDKWCNLVGAWVEHMLQGAIEVSRIYTRNSRNDIIVRLKKETDVENIIGAHRWKMFCCILHPTFQSTESYVFEFDRKRLGDPATRQWTEHVGLERIDRDVSAINLVKPYPRASWDTPSNKDLKDLATRRVPPRRPRTPTPPPRPRTPTPPRLPTPRPSTPCLPVPVPETIPSQPRPEPSVPGAFVPYEQNPHISAIDTSGAHTNIENLIEPPIRVVQEDALLASHKLVSKLDPYEEEELAAQALLQAVPVSMADAQVKVEAQENSIKNEPDRADANDSEVSRQLQEAYQQYLSSQTEPPTVARSPTVETPQTEVQRQSSSRTPQVSKEVMAAISALQSATIPSREISRQPTWTPDPQGEGPVKKERHSPPIPDRGGRMVKSTPLIKPEPRDFGIPPPQGPSSSDPSSMVPRANPSLTSVQHRSRQEPAHVQQGPRERDQSTSNALATAVKAESMEAQYPSHQNLIRDPRLIKTEDPRRRYREATAKRTGTEEDDDATSKRLRR